MIFKVRRDAAETGYWFQIIAGSGQILAASDVFATRDALEAVIHAIKSGAAESKVVDLTLEH